MGRKVSDNNEPYRTYIVQCEMWLWEGAPRGGQEKIEET